MAAPCSIALIGVGKIARDQHVPALRSNPRFALVATADPAASVPGVPAFPSLDALLAEGPPLDAVSICTPPRGRGALVAQALQADLHVMMEKPPATTLSEIAVMRALAQERRRTLFATWHSREAGAVAPAEAWLADRQITGFAIDWREDIRRWHPGQDWLLAADGFGVFDPGINALSIATAILPAPLTVTAATLEIPAGRQAPIAAGVTLSCGNATGTMTLDFLARTEPCWTIEVQTTSGTMLMTEGGRCVDICGVHAAFAEEEYKRLYARFDRLIATSRSDVDDRPSRLVADALTIGDRRTAACFAW